MLRKPTKLNSESGATLVELMVVVLIIIIVASVAVIYRGSANEQFQRQTGSRQLKEAFERARFDSVKRRAEGAELPAQVEVRSDRFILTTYTRETNGTLTAKSSQTMLPDGVVINHYSSGPIPMTISFSKRGETSGGIPQFRVCNISCASPTSATSDILIITPTGTVNLLSGGATPPTFDDPALIGNPGSGDGINYKVVMP